MTISTPAANQHTATSYGRQLDGKTALVTGGSSGIGLATAQRLAAEGAHVFLTGRNRATIDAAVVTIGAAATGIRSRAFINTGCRAEASVRGHPVGTLRGGFRLYTEADVDRLLVIRRMKPLDFTLADMLGLLDALAVLADGGTPDEQRIPAARFLDECRARRRQVPTNCASTSATPRN